MSDRDPALDDLVKLLAEWLVTDYQVEQREQREPHTDQQEVAVASAG